MLWVRAIENCHFKTFLCFYVPYLSTFAIEVVVTCLAFYLYLAFQFKRH